MARTPPGFTAVPLENGQKLRMSLYQIQIAARLGLNCQ
jgi:hypothetical protein